MADKCSHLSFTAKVDVHRLTAGKTSDADVTGYMCDVRVRCADCGRDFQFMGLPAGVSTSGAAVSVDALEARLANRPQGEQPSALDAISAMFIPQRTN